jgi:hypothetical protein
MVRRDRVGVERVQLVEILRVVRRRKAQEAIEATDDHERAADAEVAVEVDNTGHSEVRLVVAGAPGEVRIAQQDRTAGFRSTRRECPGVRTDVVGLLCVHVAGAASRAVPRRWIQQSLIRAMRRRSAANVEAGHVERAEAAFLPGTRPDEVR